MRRAGFGTLLGPEFSLRKAPRMTVRGQTVQGVCFLLRKAPLRSMVYSWSTKRPCGPLAFRRATEGSRVLRKGWGVKRGRETLVSLPLLPRRRAAAMPGLPIGSQSRLRRQAAGTAEPLPAADGKERGRACRYSKNLKVSPSALGFSAENPSFFSQDCSGFSPPEALK